MTDKQHYFLMIMKKRFIIYALLLLILMICLSYMYVSTHTLCREFKILGFSYNRDSIVVKYKEKPILKCVVVDNIDRNNIGFFYETKKRVWSVNENIALRVFIYSREKICTLDTIVVIPKENKEPYLSFISPLQYKKENIKFFVGDDSYTNKK